jgi:catechol 2,3-dioxygenase-like lactoylglutathione lyase family enzyme
MQKLLLLTLCLSLSAAAQVREVASIGLAVADLDREIRFFKNVLAFEEVGAKSTMRSAELKLGAERINLTNPITTGRPIPPDSRSFDHWFQHIAIVVSDMDKAYAQLRRHNVKHVSTGPQTLPAWNKDAGGIKAFYFRDPEDHVLEIIWFPPGKGDPKWQTPTHRLFLGIDHTAIVVSDTEKSLAFYRDLAGLRVAGGAENFGVEQEHLNQVFGARLRITALRAPKGPGIEFLEYISPPGGKLYPTDTTQNDLWFWTTDLVVDGGSPVIVRDPDGHALRLICKDVNDFATNSAQ